MLSPGYVAFLDSRRNQEGKVKAQHFRNKRSMVRDRVGMLACLSCSSYLCFAVIPLKNLYLYGIKLSAAISLVDYTSVILVYLQKPLKA